MEGLTYNGALKQIADELGNGQVVSSSLLRMGSFYEFLTETWSLSFENPEWFKNWHIQLICEDIERARRDEKFYACVLPRAHLKSTLAEAFCVYQILEKPGIDSIYISNKEIMAKYHTGSIKSKIEENSILKFRMKDHSPMSDAVVKYKYGGRISKILTSGVFTFKRGTHVRGSTICDDLLRDPNNPMSYTEIEKTEERFMREMINIPIRGAFLWVLGTPMLPNDLLFKLQEDRRFYYRALPAMNPDDEHEVLMDPPYDKKWLISQAGTTPQQQRAFQTEFMLIPYLSTITYFTNKDLDPVINRDLKNWSVFSDPKIDSATAVVAGMDVGKKRNPSHLSIFAVKDNRLIQLHESFLENMVYTEQVDYLKTAIRNFRIDAVYIDNTRGELEDRGLPYQCKMTSFNVKLKNEMAQVLESLVHSSRIELINNDRFISQILCVDANLKAPETPMGHGDSFWSVALAALAYQEEIAEKRGVTVLGEFSGDKGFIEPESPIEKSRHSGPLKCPVCKTNVGLVYRLNGSNSTEAEFDTTKCLICSQVYKKEDLV